MATTGCPTYTNVVQSEDNCNGDRKSTKCVIDENTYSQLGLGANSTQEQFNQAIYTALIVLRNKVDNLQEIIDNL